MNDNILPAPDTLMSMSTSYCQDMSLFSKMHVMPPIDIMQYEQSMDHANKIKFQLLCASNDWTCIEEFIKKNITDKKSMLEYLEDTSKYWGSYYVINMLLDICDSDVIADINPDAILHRLNPLHFGTFINHGFKFKDSDNPFLLCVQNLTRDNKTYGVNIDKSFAFVSENCIKIFDILSAHNYDLHKDEDRAFQQCVDQHVIKYFLEHNVNVNANDDACLISQFDESNGILHFPNAAIASIELLLSNGADPNARGGLPMVMACNYLFPPLINTLLKYGANPSNGALGAIPTIPQCICSEDDLVQITLKFIEAECDIKLNGLRLFKYAVRSFYLKVIKLLFEHGIDVALIEQNVNSECPKKSLIFPVYELLTENGINKETSFKLLTNWS